MKSWWAFLVTLALVSAAPEEPAHVAEQDDHMDFAVADLDADEALKDLRRFLFTSNGHDKKLHCPASPSMKVGEDYRLDLVFESFYDKECKNLRYRSMFEMNVCRKLPAKPRLDETEEAYRPLLVTWPEDEEINAPRYFSIIDVSQECGGGEAAVAVALFNSEDCDDEVPVKVVPLYEPFAQHTCTESAVGPLKTSIRQMPTELKPAKLDVRVGVFADPNCKTPYHEFSFENRVWPTYYRDIKYGCHAQYDVSKTGTPIAKSYKYSSVIEGDKLEEVRIESYNGNDRCDGTGQGQTFKAGQCTKYTLLPSHLAMYGIIGKNVYITADTQSSLRFKRWIFETSDEYLRLEQQLARRRKKQQKRAKEKASREEVDIPANMTSPQTAAETASKALRGGQTPPAANVVAEEGKKTGAPETNKNSKTAAPTSTTKAPASKQPSGTTGTTIAPASKQPASPVKFTCGFYVNHLKTTWKKSYNIDIDVQLLPGKSTSTSCTRGGPEDCGKICVDMKKLTERVDRKIAALLKEKLERKIAASNPPTSTASTTTAPASNPPSRR